MMKRTIDTTVAVEIGGKRLCNDKVSRVLHIRNVSNEITERDIANLAIPFGPIKYFVLTRKTGQALIEMKDEESARLMIEYYNTYPLQLNSKNIVMQYSRFENLSGNGMHPEADIAVKTANENVKRFFQEDAHLVLHVTVDSWNGPRLGHLHFYKLLYKFGNILRIIVFVQNQSPQALVEFDSELSAKVAKVQLSTSNCFYGWPVRIEFSTRKTLDIKHESETGRDYTISPVMKEELSYIPNFQQATFESYEPYTDYTVMRQNPSVSFTAADALQMLQPLLQAANNNSNDTLPLLQNLAPTLSYLLGQSQTNERQLESRQTTNKFSQNPFRSAVIIVANLNEDRVTPDALFILFGAYGDVVRVKILYSKKDTALIQFVDEDQAARAISNLNNVTLFGKQLRINFSKHSSLNMPKADEQNSAHLNKDYSNSRLHRFKKASSRGAQNVYPPGPVLHIAGLPEGYEEADLRRLFEQEALHVNRIKIITSSLQPQQRKMALVQMDGVEVALEALIRLHDFEVGPSRLRVSFSKGFIAK